jgi:AAA+ superfamily predicted ATPase
MPSPGSDTMPEHEWFAANLAYLEAQLSRLRLRLQRRVLWLRTQWRDDPLQAYQGVVISEAQADWLLSGESSEAEARFYRDDREAGTISTRIAQAEAALQRDAATLAPDFPPPAVEVLAHLFALGPFERDVLLLCLAPELDPTFERLFAYVQDDVNRKYVTPRLAATLLAVDDSARHTAAGSFLPEAPLRRFRLVLLEPGVVPAAPLAARPMRLDDRIADYLRGVNRLDEGVAQLLHPLPSLPVVGAQRDLVDGLQRLIEWGTTSASPPVLNLTGPPGVGKRAVARALCERLGLQVVALDATQLPPAGPERRDLVRVLEREAALLRFGIYLDLSEADAADKALSGAVEDLMERLGALLLIGSRERWRTDRRTFVARVPKPSPAAQHLLWEQALGGVTHRVNGQVAAIVQQFDFGPEAIVHAVTEAQGRARLRAPDVDHVVSADDVWQACRAEAGWRLEDLAQRVTPCFTWDDLVLPEDVLRQLQEIAAQVAFRAHVYDTWGFGARLGRGRGISALFAGPSGTGKTTAAEILANHLKLDVYRIDLAGVVSKYVGETEKNLRRVFDAAEESGAILFFDEADALFGKRAEVKDAHDRYANIEVNYLLQRMEDYRGLAILATNRKAALDRAFLRRLRFLVDFPFPDASSRRRIWEKAFPPQAAAAGLDHDALARLELAGGSIRNIALNAAFLAAQQGVPIGMSHVLHAANREYAKLEKLAAETELGRLRARTG